MIDATPRPYDKNLLMPVLQARRCRNELLMALVALEHVLEFFIFRRALTGIILPVPKMSTRIGQRMP